MDRINVDIAAMWPEEMSHSILETEDNISTHLEEEMTFKLEGMIKNEQESTLRDIRRDKDQINNCITIPTGWKGWWGMVEKEARSIERERKKEERVMKEEERRRSEREKM